LGIAISATSQLIVIVTSLISLHVCSAVIVAAAVIAVVVVERGRIGHSTGATCAIATATAAIVIAHTPQLFTNGRLHAVIIAIHTVLIGQRDLIGETWLLVLRRVVRG
jgi:ribose/xylose/arabinose/galactoside ABC-type transport system permease subunit